MAWAMQVLEYAQDWVKNDLVSIACDTRVGLQLVQDMLCGALSVLYM